MDGAAGTETPRATGRILVLCTGNICRSPYIEHLLRDALTGTGVVVESAGTGALVGSAMHPESARRLATAGVDGSTFTARQLTPELVAGADLVLGATREHVAAVGWLVPEAFDRAHSLGDLAVAMRDLSVGLTPGCGLAAIAALAAAHRRAGRLPRKADRTDVVDPYLQPERTWERMDAQVHEHLATVAAVLRTATTRPG